MVLFWKAEVVPAIDTVKQALTTVANDVWAAWDRFFTSIGDWVIENQKKLFRFSDAIKDALAGVTRLIGIDLEFASAEATAEQRAREGSSERAVGLSEGEQRRRDVLRNDPRFNPSVPAPAAAQAVAQGAAAGGPVTNSVTVNVQGNATAKDAGAIADKTAEAQARVNRRTRAALTQRAE
jgi:hypothetical protein